MFLSQGRENVNENNSGNSGSGNSGVNGNSGNSGINEFNSGHDKTKPRYKKDEIIVKVNPMFLDKFIIDDVNIEKAEINKFLNGIGRENIKQYNQQAFNISKVKAKKIFKSLKTCDVKSISRTGKEVKIPDFWAFLILEVPKNIDYQSFLKTLNSMYPLIVLAHPNYIAYYEEFTNDTYFSSQKSLSSDIYPNGNINIDSAWKIETGKKHIKVGVYDSGIDSTHEDLNVLTGFRYDYKAQDLGFYTGTDEKGHGTGVAGIIGAKRNNNIGVAGIAGGDNSENSGVSLIDFKVNGSYDGSGIELLAAAIVDGARSVNTNNMWDLEFCDKELPGYGIHLANHSYSIYLDELLDVGGDEVLEWETDIPFPDCDLCKEAFLFSLKNGVVNVVSRGNYRLSAENQNLYDTLNKYPSGFDDSWVISVGGSGTDGDLIGFNNNSDSTREKGFTSMIGRNVDVIAPATRKLVYTTKSNQVPIGDSAYMRFNGTSAAAPHVTGVVALLLSKYNKDCYSNINLDPADVEYIIQKSATDKKAIGYDDSTGWGLLNAKKALDMINFPEYQIIHPIAEPISSQIIENDTILAFLKKPLSYQNVNNSVSLGENFYSNEIVPNLFYKMNKIKYKNTYAFNNYMLQSTNFLDAWVRHSQTNTLGNIKDTFRMLSPVGLTGSLSWKTFADTFRIEPKAEIVFIDSINGIVEMTGYVYHFIERIDFVSNIEVISEGVSTIIDFWYPFVPTLENPQMTYSIYLHDQNFTSRYDFPCDSLNPLISENAEINKLQNENAFMIYPNPAQDFLTIFVKHIKPKDKIRILAFDGRVLNEQIYKNSSQKISFDIESFETGSYLIQWLSNEKVIETKKWIKL
jgi:subtilisin family serine protease